jgi:hypothetical protein
MLLHKKPDSGAGYAMPKVAMVLAPLWVESRHSAIFILEKIFRAKIEKRGILSISLWA